jgi:hypothetical protein
MRPSPSAIIATAALVVALGGTSYAVVSLPRNSVGTTQLKANAVTSPKIKDGSVAVADLAPAVRAMFGTAGSSGAQGAIGPEGPAGAAGPQGPTGPTGLTGATGATGGSGVASQGGVSGETSTDPPVSNTVSVETYAFTLTSPGRLLMLGRGRFRGTCASGNPAMAIYVDGVGVPNSGLETINATDTEASLFGVTAVSITAGAHTATLRVGCDTNVGPSLVSGLHHAISFVNLGG